MLATLYFLLSEAQGTSNDLDAIRDIFLFVVTAAVLLVNVLRRKPWARFLIILISIWLSFRWFRLFWLVQTYGGQFFDVLLFALGYLAAAGLLCMRSAVAWFPPFRMRQVFDTWQSLSNVKRISWSLFVASLVMIHLSAYGGGGNGLFGLLGAVSGVILFVIYSIESYERASRSEGSSSVSCLVMSISLFVIAVFYPSASLGYLFLVIFPLQMFCAAMLLGGLLKSGWKEPRLSKPYFLTLACVSLVMFGFLGFGMIRLFTSGIQLH